MKKNQKFHFLSIFASIMILSACGSTDSVTNTEIEGVESPNTSSGSYNLSMPLGGTSGTFYIQGAALAEHINQKSDTLRVVPATSGGGVENTRLVGSGQADIGMAFAGDLYNAWLGQEPFETEYRDYRQLGPAQQISGWNFMVLANSGIDSIDDLVGKHFSPGAPGSGSAAGGGQLLKDYGIYDDISISYHAWGELPGMLQNGDIQGFNRTGGIPIPVAQEIDITHSMKVLDLKHALDEVNFFENYPYYSEFTIPAGTYSGQDEDAITFGMDVKWLVHKDVPDEAVMEFLKLSYTEEASSHMDNVFPEHDHRSDNPLDLIVPLHPAAEKFWKDQGYDLPEPLLSE